MCLFNQNKKNTNIVITKALKINYGSIKRLDEYDDEAISDDRNQLLKKRTMMDVQPGMKYLLERWIPI